MQRRFIKRDLTKGNIVKNLLVVSVPTMFGFFAQTLYDFIDMIWIGRISAQAVAGVTIFSTIFWISDIFSEIIGVSAVSLISQSYGSGHTDKTKEIMEQSIFFKLLVSAVMAIILTILLKPLSYFFLMIIWLLNIFLIMELFVPCSFLLCLLHSV